MMASRSPYPITDTYVDKAMRGALKIAVLMSLTYVAFVAVGLVLPNVPEENVLAGLYVRDAPDTVKNMFGLLVYGWVLVALIWSIRGIQRLIVRGVRRRVVTDLGRKNRRRRAFHVVTLAAVVLPYAILAVEVAFRPGAALKLLLCLPTTAFALWSIHRMQRFRRMPVWLPLAAFCWGALIAPGYSASAEILSVTLSYRVLPAVHSAQQILNDQHAVATTLFFSAGLFEELAKGAGIAMIFLLFSRHLDGVVSGIVIGGAAGLGFNLSESFSSMSQAGGVAAGSQFWLRQSVGLMAAHTAFSALVGAGFGIAQRSNDDRLRKAAIVWGFVAAVGGHFASDAILAAKQEHRWLSSNPTLDLLIVLPVVIVILQGPFVAMYLWLLRRGLREQAHALAAELQAEARTGHGAITTVDATVLQNPALRFWLKITALRRHGLTAYRQLNRLHAAQFDLAMQRWRSGRQQAVGQDADLQRLRNRVLTQKSSQIVVVQPAQQLEKPI